MASHPTSSTILALFLLTISSLQVLHVSSSFEFQVGDAKSWAVPASNDSKMYNDWASENRFRVGDTIRFKYRKDSVMEVIESDYKKCNSTHPIFFSNTGNTVYRLERSGAFYFISGAAGHCERGQRMIVKVMSPEDASRSTPAQPSSSSSSSSSAAAASGAVITWGYVQYSVLSFVAASSCLSLL